MTTPARYLQLFTNIGSVQHLKALIKPTETWFRQHKHSSVRKLSRESRTSKA